MSDTVLSGRWTVYYKAENRQQRVTWTGGSASPDAFQDLYLAIQDLFDEQAQMDDSSPLGYDTPTEFRLGLIDSGSKDPWFIDLESMEHVTGAACTTDGWKRVQDSNVGIVKIQTTSCNIVEADIGFDITHADLDAGTLLDVKDFGGSVKELWVRPDTDAAADNFDSAAGTLTCNANTATQNGASTTGEMKWVNLQAIGSLVEDTHLYVYQGVKSGDTAPDAIVTGYKTTWNWWGDGFFDVLMLVADQSSDLTTRSTYIDGGYVTTLARQYGKNYTYFITDCFGKGQISVPLETADDKSNTTGWRTMTLSTSSGNWTAGDEIEGATTGARGIITSTSAANPDIVLRYYLIENTTVDFGSAETVDNNDDTGTGTYSSSANYGPALLAGLSVTHGADNTHDIDEDGTNEYFSIVFDISDESLADSYEWSKYTYRDGNTVTTHADGIEAEQYLGSDYRISYTGITGAVAEGDVVTQANTLATGTVVAHHTTPDILILRNCRGTFNNTDQVEVDGGNYVTGPTSEPIAPIKACPLGNFFGGQFFFAPGVVPENYQVGEANNFECITDDNLTVKVPTKVTVTMSNTRIRDGLIVVRLSGEGLDTEKDYYAIDTVTSIGDTSISVDPNIRVDEPGKSTGGVLFVGDTSAEVEHRYRYLSWSGDDFALFQKAADVAEALTTTTKIVATGGFTNCQVGDIIYNSSRTAVTYISEIVDDDEVNVFPAVASQQSGDNFRVGAVVEVYAVTNDYVYVAIMAVEETAGTDASPGSESITMVYSSDVYVKINGRHSNDATNPEYDMKNFSATNVTTSTGMSVPVIRTPEQITD